MKTAARRTPDAAGLVLGAALDAVLGDPRRGHPVAAFGRAAAALERRVYTDSRGSGAVFAGVCVAGAAALGLAAGRVTRGRPLARTAVTAAATWAVLGGTSLGREGAAMARSLEAGDLTAARDRLPHLCARDPAGLGAGALARATVESLAENTSDAAVAPLVWGAVAGVPGLLAYRAVNTLDAMVGYRNPRYARFGWAAARLDDVANWVPARLTGLLTVACAPLTAGPGRTPTAKRSRTGGPARLAAARESYRVLRRDGGRHPSPNAGRCEAAFAGALGVRIGGVNVYGGHVEARPELGDGRPPEVPDLRRAVRLSRAVTLAAAVLSAVIVRSVPVRAGGRR
ncbi:cobalamin biosynthesis protein [Actinomadura scrupuli]|uniref:cobalamin biosynthesis protein n=1 Tax=Actinomadura scrupuli TaxID=559629 RepID=UPI003D99EF79